MGKVIFILPLKEFSLEWFGWLVGRWTTTTGGKWLWVEWMDGGLKRFQTNHLGERKDGCFAFVVLCVVWLSDWVEEEDFMMTTMMVCIVLCLMICVSFPFPVHPHQSVSNCLWWWWNISDLHSSEEWWRSESVNEWIGYLRTLCWVRTVLCTVYCIIYANFCF